MNANVNQVYESALALSEPDRAQLVDRLIGTLAPEHAAPLDDAWLAEIERRSREIDASQATLVPWSVVKEHARAATRHGAQLSFGRTKGTMGADI
jgi:putative addiction module component (TIGR02574 family)